MAGRKRTRKQRTIAINQKTRREIAKYAEFIPSLKKVSKAAASYRLTPAQMAQVSRARKKLRHTDALRPVTEKQAKILQKEGALVGGGVRAVHLRNTSPSAKISIRKNGMIVTSNGVNFEYHPTRAEIDALAEKGEELLARSDVRTIFLWTNKGRANEGFSYIAAWLKYLQDYFNAYANQSEWIKGVVAEISATPIEHRSTEQESAQRVRDKVEQKKPKGKRKRVT